MGHRDGEQRKHPRSARRFKGVEDAARPGVLNHVDNISCAGVLCHTIQEIAPMTKMAITLELPHPFNTKRIQAEGVVLRCDPDRKSPGEYKVAILYTKLDDDDYETIRRYVEHDLAHSTREP